MSTQQRGRLYAFLAFLACYLIFALALHRRGARDPDSVFFDPDHAFERHYSALREAEADDFTLQFADATTAPHYSKASESPDFCVGIPTVRRSGASYLKNTIGSLLAGLTQQERESLYLAPFIANIQPEVHDLYNASWLDHLSDRVLTYNEAPTHVQHEVQHLDEIDASEHQRKPLFDYIYLLQQCLQHTTAPYILMLEDDVLAADGWLLRTKRALDQLSQRADFPNTIYLRLFYNEGLLGFNSESWPTYLTWSLSLDLLLLTALLAFRHYSAASRKHLTIFVLATICLVCAPMLLGLYFAAGRLTVSPLPRGLNRMDAYGCCSQAFVFPRARLPDLIAYYETQGRGMVDSLTEVYANERGMARYALTPAAFQHVGATSSKDVNLGKYGRRNTELIWNFEFELARPEVLAALHE